MACAERFSKHNVKPLCRRKEGCPIRDLAQDIEVNKKVAAYLGARALMQFEHLRNLGHSELIKHGLDKPILLIRLESIIKKYNDSQQEKERSKQELVSLSKKSNMGGR